MKKKNFVLVGLSTLMAAALGLGVLTACQDGAEEVKPTALVDGVNCYYGDGEDVHLKGWIASVTNDAWTIDENYTDAEAEGSPVVTHLGYSKNDAWRNFGVKIDGEYSDFAYLNITMRAKARVTDGAVSVFLKIVNPVTGREDMNVLGSDLYFDVSTDVYTTYTFEIPSKYRQILDIANDVCLFPEPGIANSDSIHAGDIYVKDMWFSEERPADGVAPVDDTWRTEAWCGYEVTRGGENEAVITYNKPADWSRFYRPVPKDEIFLENGTINNMLKLQFTSDTITFGSTEYADSVEQFQFGIWGDPNPGTEAAYYQQWFGQYYRDKYEDTQDWSNNPSVFKVEKDETTGVVTLYCQVAPALMAMAGHFDQQIWLVFNLESQPHGGASDQAPGYIHGAVPFDGIGQMTILSSEFYFDENAPVYTEPVVNESGWENNAANAYTISSEKSGVLANVTYENLAYNLWSCIVYPVSDAQRKNTVTITLRNNGEEDILYGIDLSDEANRQYGYLAPGETKELKLQNAAAYDAINFFIDTCYPGYDASVTEGTFSGDLDIVSLEFSDETISQPETPSSVNGWGIVESGKSLYTISAKEGVLANVTYAGVSPTLWANLYRDVAANERTDTVEITLRNNGTEKALYGIDLADQATRQYGWLEAGETKTVTLTNSAAYTVINFFLDCCYQGDFTTDKETLSGDIDIVSLNFVGEPEPTPEDGLVWTTTSANLSLNGKVITLNNLMDGAWQNVSASLTLTSGGKISVPVTNNTNAIAKFKLSVMYDNDQGGWSDLEGNGTTVCWLEIPQGETWNMELAVSAADASRVAHIMLMVACWDKDGVQADGTTPRPEPPYTGTVTIGDMTFTPDETQPSEPQGTVVAATWGTDAANLSVSDKTVTLNNLPIDAWQNVNANLTLSGACKLTLSITNNTGAVAKFKLQLMDSAWKQIGADSDPCVCWMEIAAGETMELTLTVTAEQAAQVAHIMLMVDCWATNDVVTGTGAPCPAGPYTGTIVLGDVKIF